MSTRKAIHWAAVTTGIGIILGLAGGWLARRDYQIVTDERVQTRLAAMENALGAMRMQADRSHAYQIASYVWAVKVAQKLDWPSPPEPQFYLPSRSVPEPPGAGVYAQEAP